MSRSTSAGETYEVAIIGAGFSGLTCAQELIDSGVAVRVFEKSRGPGGRMSTRRVEVAGEQFRFDHGAQYFTVRSSELEARVSAWVDAGIVAEWKGRLAVVDGQGLTPKSRGVARFVGVPGMSAICRHLARGLDVTYRAQVSSLARTPHGLQLYGASGEDLGRFGRVICTAPPIQTASLFRDLSPEIAQQIEPVPMRPCWAVMVVFDESIEVDADGVFVNVGPLSWAARNSAKPGRPGRDAWVLHGNPAWSLDHIDREPNTIGELLLAAFFEAVDVRARPVRWCSAHRWRYAMSAAPLAQGYLYDENAAIGACGDWANGDRVEGAFLSGLALARRLLGA